MSADDTIDTVALLGDEDVSMLMAGTADEILELVLILRDRHGLSASQIATFIVGCLDRLGRSEVRTVMAQTAHSGAGVAKVRRGSGPTRWRNVLPWAYRRNCTTQVQLRNVSGRCPGAATFNGSTASTRAVDWYPPQAKKPL